MTLFLITLLYVLVGGVAYSVSVFEDEDANLVDFITYALIGGLVLAIRVFRNAAGILGQELQGAKVPEFITDTCASIKRGAVNLYNSI